MSRLIENRLHSPPPVIQLTPVTETQRLNFIQQCPDLISHRIENDPFKSPFSDRVRTDPFTGAVFIKEEDSWFESPTIEDAIHFIVHSLKEQGEDRKIANTLLIHHQLKDVFSFLRNTNIDGAKNLTRSVFVDCSLGEDVGDTITNSLAQSINGTQTVVTNFLRWINTFNKHVLSKTGINEFSTVLMVLLLERSMERLCLEQVLEVFSNKSTELTLKDMAQVKEYLSLVAIRLSPYRQVAGRVMAIVSGAQNDENRKIIEKLIEGDEEQEKFSKIENIEDLLKEYCPSSTRKQRINNLINASLKRIRVVLSEETNSLSLPIVQTEFDL